jgi:glutathione S-transferase
VIYDSRVITRYLDEELKAGLYPQGARLWDTLTLEATADGMTDAAVLIRYEYHVRPEASRSSDWAEGQWQKIDRALSAIEAGWITHLFGPLDMGQIALGCALGYLDFRMADRDWRRGRPALAAWKSAFAARPAMQSTRPQA